ncbi:rhombosortase [Magnetococcus sp. PR-3]|uniref:rhombosortase n=1 Tax=Magnetococcus sp. PR-3 TaxID=3120355 RepID=UPI002FCDF3C1
MKDLRQEISWLGVVLIPLLIWWGTGPVPPYAIWDLDAVRQGELWRILTSHWVHLNEAHLRLNIIMLAGLAVALGASATLWSLAVGMIGVNIWLWLDPTAPLYYGGLSGALHAPWALLLIRGLRQHTQNKRYVLLFVGTCGKLGWELYTGSSLFIPETSHTAVYAHVAGFAGGLWVGVLHHLPRSKQIT